MPGQGFLQFISGIIKNENPTSSLASAQIMLLICLLHWRAEQVLSPVQDCNEVTRNLCLLNSVHSLSGIF